MDLREFNLNLLVALEALLTEKNVTHAGRRLNLSQSAMSGALSRLRDFFQDDLLVPVGRRMVLTPLAEDLEKPVRDVLLQVSGTIATKLNFDPATSNRHFSIAVSDYLTSVLMIDFLRDVKSDAPGVTFELRALGPRANADLDRGALDFVIAPAEAFPESPHATEPLFDDVFVCVAWTKNAHVGDSISLDQYLRLGHVAVRVVEEGAGNHDEVHLRRLNCERRIEVVTPAFDLAPQLIVGTNRIATVPARLAHKYAKLLPIRLLPLPVAIPPLREKLWWHRAHNQAPGHRWLRGQLRTAVDRLESLESPSIVARRGPARVRLHSHRGGTARRRAAASH